MNIHTCNDDLGRNQYKILQHLFHLAVANAPKDWEFFGSNTSDDQQTTEYRNKQSGDRVKAWSFNRVEGEFTKHLFVFKQGSAHE